MNQSKLLNSEKFKKTSLNVLMASSILLGTVACTDDNKSTSTNSTVTNTSNPVVEDQNSNKVNSSVATNSEIKNNLNESMANLDNVSNNNDSPKVDANNVSANNSSQITKEELFGQTEFDPNQVLPTAENTLQGNVADLPATLQEPDIDTLVKNAENGNPQAQFELGEKYLNGVEIEKDLDKAFYWYKKAADQGHALAQNNVGLLYTIDLKDHKRDMKIARTWMEKAAAQNNGPALCNLGKIYFHGDGVDVDYNKAATYFLKAADFDVTEAQVYLGQMFYNGQGVPKNAEKAVVLYQKAAELRDPKGQYYLGYAYLTGDGINKDPRKAFKFIQRSAMHNFPESLNLLGEFYLQGIGTDKNIVEATAFFKKAAAFNQTDALYRLADMHLNGILDKDENVIPEVLDPNVDPKDVKLTPNYKKAEEYLEKAAKLGHIESKYLLGLMYAKGLTIAHDDEMAFKLFDEAAKAGHAGAQKELQKIMSNLNEK